MGGSCESYKVVNVFTDWGTAYAIRRWYAYELHSGEHNMHGAGRQVECMLHILSIIDMLSLLLATRDYS